MKEIHELVLPEDVRYAEDHEWAKLEGDQVRIGVSDYAQDQLGDITFVELPGIGAEYTRGAEFGTLESTKAVSSLYLPLGGKILAVNEALPDAPGLINQDPYGQGWLVLIEPAAMSELDDMMTRDAYLERLKGL